MPLISQYSKVAQQALYYSSKNYVNRGLLNTSSMSFEEKRYMVRCNLVIDMQMTSEKINIQNKTKNLAKNSQGIRCTTVCF